jgi:hypothetical protein
MRRIDLVLALCVVLVSPALGALGAHWRRRSDCKLVASALARFRQWSATASAGMCASPAG